MSQNGDQMPGMLKIMLVLELTGIVFGIISEIIFEKIVTK